jgi:pimeloyl-[acyl-carrier protein] methyl ester esterase
MLHGWAMHGGVWRQFARQLAASCQVICVDLPGHGRSTAISPYTLQQVALAVLDALPAEEFTVLGWSLGATVALEMSRLSPQRISSLFMLSANPCFVGQGDWPGMSAELLAAFMAQLQKRPEQTLSRFLALQVNESAAAKAVLQQLKTVIQEYPPPQTEILRAGLKILAESDLRPVLIQLNCPLYLILGDRDTLIPLAAAAAVQALNPSVRLYIIETAGHVPFLSHQQDLLNILLAALSA